MVTMKKKVAVYGTLLSGLGNNFLLADSKLIGTFETDPLYKMVDLDGYPGIVKGGVGTIAMEVYEVDNKTLHELDRLEGYKKSNAKDANLYIRETIATPYGMVFTYFYNQSIRDREVILSGNYKTHLEYKKVLNYAK